MITKEGKKQLIIDAVTAMQGCKATELCVIGNIVMDVGDELPDLITELINEGKLIEIEYVLPEMDYRIKSFLLPGKSKVYVGINTTTVKQETG